MSVANHAAASGKFLQFLRDRTDGTEHRRPVRYINDGGPLARSSLRLLAFVTKGEANEGFRTVRRDCRGIAGRGLQRSPKHVVNDAAKLVEHVAIESLEQSVEPLVVAVGGDGFVRSIESVVESIGRRIVELIGFRPIVIRQLIR